MADIRCLRCQASFDGAAEQCPNCGERVTHFQRTYSTRLIDGKYQILERLGLGGMGEIFKVRHIHLNEERVIKIMRANIASDDQSLQRFLQEARTSTMIKHRNLAMLYDFSTLEDGSYYMVWEYIDGTNIQKWVAANGPVPQRFATEISIQALNGLEHLHQMGLIHRDISPENIMLSTDHHGKLLAKVIDFGIAKQLSEGEGGQGLTQTGMFVGKLKYASPEQAGFLKEEEHIDPRSDIYSYGIVLYEMLAGRAPFVATNPQGYILKHVTEKPAPISQINPDAKVYESLERIVMRALEKDRNQRYHSASEMVNDLESVRDTLPVDPVDYHQKLATMSGRTTIGKSRSTGTSPTLGATVPGRPGSPSTRVDTGTVADVASTFPGGATVADRPATLGGNATVVERVGSSTGSGSQPTVVERAGMPLGTVADVPSGSGSMPTIVEGRQTWGGAPPTVAGAAPTVVERRMTMEGEAGAKSKLPLVAGIVAILVAVIVGAWFVLKPKDAGPDTDTTATSVTPIATRGVVLLTSPYGEKVAAQNLDTNKPAALPGTSVPLRAELEPGRYRFTFEDASGTSWSREVSVEAGKEARIEPQELKVNLDQVVDEVVKP
ncbi:MAG: protein kinase [Thermoanaerobaculia bacterium]|jgi:serine/threonine-protein kinase